jgi:ribosome-binding protein aMBF1 (putative translation factor)
MRRKKLKKTDLAKMLGISNVILESFCVEKWSPSSHLEKQMKEVLGISVARVTRVSARRQQKAKGRQVREASQRKAA